MTSAQASAAPIRDPVVRTCVLLCAGMSQEAGVLGRMSCRSRGEATTGPRASGRQKCSGKRGLRAVVGTGEYVSAPASAGCLHRTTEDDMRRLVASLVACGVLLGPAVLAQAPKDLDARVTKFLEDHRGDWHDLNVPEADGQLLHDLVRKGPLHAGAGDRHVDRPLRRSGPRGRWRRPAGSLVTIEIDTGRHDQAVRNFQGAGLAAFVDARLADAHELVPKLEGPVRLRLHRRRQGLVHARTRRP